MLNTNPHPGASPDIRLTVDNHRPLWIEAAYLYPRFWDEERRSYAIASWLTEEIDRRGLPSGAIRVRFDGRRSTAGFKRALPRLDEKSSVLKHPDLLRFFDGILSVCITESVAGLSKKRAPGPTERRG